MTARTIAAEVRPGPWPVASTNSKRLLNRPEHIHPAQLVHDLAEVVGDEAVVLLVSYPG